MIMLAPCNLCYHYEFEFFFQVITLDLIMWINICSCHLGFLLDCRQCFSEDNHISRILLLWPTANILQTPQISSLQMRYNCSYITNRIRLIRRSILVLLWKSMSLTFEFYKLYFPRFCLCRNFQAICNLNNFIPSEFPTPNDTKHE